MFETVLFETMLSEVFLLAVWEISQALAVVVFLANMITIWLPNESSNKYVDAVLKFLNKLSLNIAKNANITRQAIKGEFGLDAKDKTKPDESLDRKDVR